MRNKKYMPLIGKLFYAIWIPTSLLMLTLTVLAAFEPVALIALLPVDVFTFYFLFSPLFGYVELRENSLFIKFGFFMKRNIPYSDIRGITKERKMYSESMVSLKSSMEHVNIKYNRFDVTTVSVKENDEFIEALEQRITLSKSAERH